MWIWWDRLDQRIDRIVITILRYHVMFYDLICYLISSHQFLERCCPIFRLNRRGQSRCLRLQLVRAIVLLSLRSIRSSWPKDAENPAGRRLNLVTDHSPPTLRKEWRKFIWGMKELWDRWRLIRKVVTLESILVRFAYTCVLSKVMLNICGRICNVPSKFCFYWAISISTEDPLATWVETPLFPMPL